MRNVNNGPRVGKSHGRNRRTAINLASKQGSMPTNYGPTTPSQPFPVGPSDATAFGLQRGNLWYNYRVQNAALRAQAQMARLGFQNAKGSIQQQTKAGLSETQGEMDERGMIGSTVNTAAREDVRAEGASQKTAAREAFIQAIMASRLGKLQNMAQLRMGLGELAIQKAAAKRELALAAFGSAGLNPWGYATNTSG